jgi:DNA modification methylase
MSELLVPDAQIDALAECDSNPGEELGFSDPRNTLNDLSGAEWIQETKSFFFQKGLGNTHPHAQIERLHPAPFSYQDVQRLVTFFSKKGQVVLDPFAGVGSTAKACALSGRKCVGIELAERWDSLARQRLEVEVGVGQAESHTFIHGDTRVILKDFATDSFDFVVTSPPYWSILNKRPDHKSNERVSQSLATSYSEDDRDLGNVDEYDDFLSQLAAVFKECGRVLKLGRYMALIVSDFRHQARFHAFHSDLIQQLEGMEVSSGVRLALQGVKVLLQNHKSLKPYGYPFAYVENIHHQYILIFRKVGVGAR